MRFIIATDAWIQRRFDAVVHWVMLTFGVSKGFVRQALWAEVIVAFVADIVLHGISTTSACEAVAVTSCCFQSWRSKHADDAAESSGHVSSHDYAPSGLKIMWLVIMTFDLLFLVAAIVESHDAKSIRSLLFSTAVSVGFVSLEYLRKTSPTPPPKQETSRVLQPQAQQ